MPADRLSRWERRTDKPLLAGAVVFLAAYAWPVLDPGLPAGVVAASRWATLTVWLLFAADLLLGLRLADDRRHFLRNHWLDVATLILPVLRPLDRLRAVAALSVLGRRGSTFARGRVVASVVAAEIVVAFVAAVAVLDAERANPEANIASFGDASWWAAATVTTVGYGDRFPTTTEGRIVGVALMVSGIALLGVITAAIASWFVERLAEVHAAEERTQAEVADVEAALQALRAEVVALRDDVSRGR